MKKAIELYHSFRQELDRIWIPDIIARETVQEITYEGQVVGIICGAPDYIDCIYILPEYRRKGLAKEAALSWYEENKQYEIRLHIINKNEGAKAFWNGVFQLREIGDNEVDTLYEIEGVRENDL